MLGILVVGFSCLACGVVGYGISVWMQGGGFDNNQPIEVEVIPPPEEVVVDPTPDDPVPGELAPSDPVTDDPIPTALSSANLLTLIEEEIPINDPIDIARRLDGLVNIPLTLPVENLNRKVGEKETFWVSDTDTAENFQIEATLSAVTDHLYFWIEDGVDYSKRELDRLAAEFEDNIYPTNQEFFGSEWTPGVDEDPHLYVIYARGLGVGLAGYYNSIDEYTRDSRVFQCP